MKKKFLIFSRTLCLFTLSVALIAFMGCGGGTSGTGPLRGVFVDAPVEGLDYTTSSGITGKTDASGMFYYDPGDTVTFKIGSLTLGSAKGASQVTPVDIVSGGAITDQRVQNMLVLLQTLDEDGDLNNGIKINTVAAGVVSANASKIKFDQATAAFAADTNVTALLTALNAAAGAFTDQTIRGNRTLRSASDAVAHFTNTTSERYVVSTQFGRVSGYADTDYDVWIWKGIPYAKAPVGSLRWKAPQDPDTWTGTREATDNCDVCIQQVYNQYWMSSNAFVGSEDCLYLDIYRPKTSDTNLPVFVWIHGGSNNFGSARQYNGSALAKRGNMIVVIVQYRLNAMGFLTHPSLRQSGTDADKSGNYGTLDQIKALTWVKNNIAYFGGDPNKVVVGGQSAGAHNTMNLIISPLAQGLFRGAIVMSAAMNIYSQAYADTMTDTTIKGLLIRAGRASNPTEAAQVLEGMTDAEIEAFLRSQPAELVVRCRRDGTGADGTGSMTTHSAIKDGTVIKHSSWLEAIGVGEYNKVPVMIGSTEYEWKDFQGLYGAYVKYYSINRVPSSQYTWFDAYKVIGVGGNLALTDVLPTQRDQDIYTSVATLRSRLWKVTGVDQIARALKTNDASNGVWAYLFKWAGGGDPALANFKFLFGAAHAMEIPFFFGYPTDAWNYSFTSANKTGREALQLAMMDYLIAFVKNLNPNPTGSSLPTWSEWDNAAGANKFISFDADLTNYIIQSSVYEETLSAVQADVATAKTLYPEAAAVYTLFGM